MTRLVPNAPEIAAKLEEVVASTIFIGVPTMPTLAEHLGGMGRNTVASVTYRLLDELALQLPDLREKLTDVMQAMADGPNGGHDHLNGRLARATKEANSRR